MGGPSTLLNLDMKKIDKASPAKNTYTSGSCRYGTCYRTLGNKLSKEPVIGLLRNISFLCSGEAWDKEFPSQATRQYDQFKGELGASGSSSSSSSGK